MTDGFRAARLQTYHEVVTRRTEWPEMQGHPLELSPQIMDNQHIQRHT